MKDVDSFIQKALELKPGDIIIYEDLFEDVVESDLFPFDNDNEFVPSHTAAYISGDKPLAHSVRDGYHLPGLRITNMQEGRAYVFRLNDQNLAKNYSELIKHWALLSKNHTLASYKATYPESYWKDRTQKDLNNFFSNPRNQVNGPLISFPEPRASRDRFDIVRNPSVKGMTPEGIRRAIKFASRTNMLPDEQISKGQRCTPMVIAAIQACYLSPIVRQVEKKTPFKQYKDISLANFADEVLIPHWDQTSIGKLLHDATAHADYSNVFPHAFNCDQRYALPHDFFKRLQECEQIESVGRFSLSNNKALVESHDGKMSEYNCNASAPINR